MKPEEIALCLFRIDRFLPFESCLSSFDALISVGETITLDCEELPDIKYDGDFGEYYEELVADTPTYTIIPHRNNVLIVISVKSAWSCDNVTWLEKSYDDGEPCISMTELSAFNFYKYLTETAS